MTASHDCPKCGTRIHLDEHCPKCSIVSHTPRFDAAYAECLDDTGAITRLEPLYNLCRRLEFETRQAALDKPRPNCPGCGNEIDPEVCHCGDIRTAHDSMADHSFVPMGCDCGRVKLPDDLSLKHADELAETIQDAEEHYDNGTGLPGSSCAS